MTVLVGLVRPDGVSIVADRAAVHDGVYLREGTPWPADDITKVCANRPSKVGRELIAGIAGKAASPNADLTTGLPRLLDTVDGVRQAAVAVAELFDGQAGDDLREHAGLTATSATPFGEPVVTVVLLGGRTRHGYTLTAVGLLAAGGARSIDLRDSVVYAPTSVQADAGLMLLNQNASSGIEQARDAWLGNMSDLAPIAAVKQRLAVTPDCDHATISPAGATGVVRHSPPRKIGPEYYA